MSGISSDTDHRSLTCPNAPPEVGSALFGIFLDNGCVAYISPSIPVTTVLLKELCTKSIPIENRLRFSGPCMGKSCQQWRKDRCSLVDAVVANPDVADASLGNAEISALPHCGIRASCRWFAQHQQAACSHCPSVIRKPAVLYEGTS